MGCQDNVSFEAVRKTKMGMTIDSIEANLGAPVHYKYINDTCEERGYLYDTPNGMDKFVMVYYVNEIATKIEDK